MFRRKLLPLSSGCGQLETAVSSQKTTNFIEHKSYMGHVVAQLIEELRYKSEGRGFDSRCCHWNFSLT